MGKLVYLTKKDVQKGKSYKSVKPASFKYKIMLGVAVFLLVAENSALITLYLLQR